MKVDILCLPACGCESDSGRCENTVSLENQDEENMSGDSSDSDYADHECY